MKRISSRDNPFFKTLRQLAGDAGTRRDAGIALVEGVHLCDAYLQSGGVPRQVVIGESAFDHAEVVDLLDRVDQNAQRYLLDDALFKSLSQLASGVPLMMLIERPHPQLPERIERTSVLLDRVQDPGNVGSILRSAAAAGIVDVYLSAACASAWSTKVLRAAMGAHFHLLIFEDCNLEDLARSDDVPWIATSPHADRSIYEVDLAGEVAWLFGHEGQGLEASLMGLATAVRIPQPGKGESLNVAASAAICFFEQARQKRR
jgi:TrmH family RNA methyltransferase